MLTRRIASTCVFILYNVNLSYVLYLHVTKKGILKRVIFPRIFILNLYLLKRFLCSKIIILYHFVQVRFGKKYSIQQTFIIRRTK